MTDSEQKVLLGQYLEPISFADFKVSWVGPADLLWLEQKFGPSVCYGSEDGRLIFATLDGVDAAGFASLNESEEAVNGYAAKGNCQVVTTRVDVTFLWNQFGAAGEPKSAKIHSGAHGVVATRAGHFVASMGERGLAIVKASQANEHDVLVSNDPTHPLYFYQSIALPVENDFDVIVSAVRKAGIAAGVLPHDLSSYSVNTITPHGLDVIDVCALGDALGTAALGKDGTLMLFRDILNDKEPINLKFKNIRGVAYRVLCSRGHVFMLTSKGFYVLADLARNFLNSKTGQTATTHILDLPMTAVDANICHDRFIYIVDDEGDVSRLDIEKVNRDLPRESRDRSGGESSRIAVRFEQHGSTLKNRKAELQSA